MFSLFVLWDNIKAAELEELEYSSVLLRIMTNHIQLIFLVQSLRLDWPYFVMEYYESVDKAGDSSEIALNLDWIINRDSIQPVYANLIGLSVIPFILCVLTVIIWAFIKCCRRSMTWTKYWHYVKGTIINMLFLLHPTFLKSIMEMFACSTIEGS